MVRTSAWFLNFDAEDELARPAGYTPSPALLRRFPLLTSQVQALLLPGDVLVPDLPTSPPLPPGCTGRAWCPTPRAVKALCRAGATVLPGPDLAVLRAVNHRRFSATLGQTLPGAHYARTLAEVDAALAQIFPGGTWLLKRPFGFAGRGRIRLDPARSGDRDHARSWIEASLRAGEGLQVEPLVDRLADFALHGQVCRTGEIILGEPTRQECDATGAWSSSTRALPGDLDTPESDALLVQADLAARALQRAGYFGPFGIDAFRWKTPEGKLCFNPRSEINARYSMGWPVGMGGRRPDLE